MRGAWRARRKARWGLALVLLAACGQSSGVTSRRAEAPTTTPPDTVAPSTSPTSTTIAATTSEPATTTSTTAVVTEGFVPPCVESHRDSPSTVNLDESALASFGPLQAEPALVVNLPKGIAEASGEITTTAAQATRVPRGVLLGVRASSTGYFAGSMLTVVDDDGTLRWVRCWSDNVGQVFVAPAATAPTSALATVFIDQGNSPPRSEHRLISLANGDSDETLRDRLATQGIDGGTALDSDWPKAWNDTYVLLGPPDGTIIDTGRDHLVRIDLRTMTAELIPYPPGSNGTDSIYNGFRLDADGNPYLYGFEDGHDVVLTAFHDGGWSDGPVAVTSEPTVNFEFTPPEGQVPRLVAFDANGSMLWRRDDITSQQHEGFSTGQSGDVTIATGCIGSYVDFECDAPALIGVSTATGETRWVLDGQHGVVAEGDGYALVTDAISDVPAGWMLIDTNTGQPVDGQRWDDPATFQQECCGGEEFWFVHRDGGVVIAAHETQLGIWYPRNSGLVPHDVSLP